MVKLREIPATKLIEGASGAEVLTALAEATFVPGMAMAIRDGKLLVETPEDTQSRLGRGTGGVLT